MIEWMQTDEFQIQLLNCLIDEAIEENDFVSCTVYLERLDEIKKRISATNPPASLIESQFLYDISDIM
jgi:hypothetical protein